MSFMLIVWDHLSVDSICIKIAVCLERYEIFRLVTVRIRRYCERLVLVMSIEVNE